MNERKTEDMVEHRLRNHGYYAPDSEIVVEKQHSDSARINKLLANASKSGKQEWIVDIQQNMKVTQKLNMENMRLMAFFCTLRSFLRNLTCLQ